MLPLPVRKGLRSGTIFSVVIIFLALIGFTVIASGLIARLFGLTPQAAQTSPAFVMIFLGLLGIWNGAQAARPGPLEDRLSDTLVSSLAAGLLSGVMSAILALIFVVLARMRFSRLAATVVTIATLAGLFGALTNVMTIA